MKIFKVPTYLFRIARRPIADGRLHIELCVTFYAIEGGKKKWIQKTYSTYQYCLRHEFDLILNRSKKVRIELYDIRSKIHDIITKVEKVIFNDKAYDPESFERYYLSEYSSDDIAIHFDAKIQELEASHKFSSKEKYKTALKSFQEYFKTDFTFSGVTSDRLQAYEDWYTSQSYGKNKRSLTSVGINCRGLRHIFNRAIKAGVILPGVYPFGLGKYVIPEGGDDTKKFLSNDDKNAFLSWRSDSDLLNRLHDYACFSYYANGINLSDVARLRRSDLNKEYISITRQKTKGRKKKSRKLIIPMHPVMNQIINRSGKRSLDPGDYVFPILEKEMDEQTIFYTIRDLVDDVNKLLRKIGNQLNFEFIPTSYTLRHTFAFNMMQLGATTDDLQDALAHGSSKTTEHYKHGFTLERKKKFSEGL